MKNKFLPDKEETLRILEMHNSYNPKKLFLLEESGIDQNLYDKLQGMMKKGCFDCLVDENPTRMVTTPGAPSDVAVRILKKTACDKRKSNPSYSPTQSDFLYLFDDAQSSVWTYDTSGKFTRVYSSGTPYKWWCISNVECPKYENLTMKQKQFYDDLKERVAGKEGWKLCGDLTEPQKYSWKKVSIRNSDTVFPGGLFVYMSPKDVATQAGNVVKTHAQEREEEKLAEQTCRDTIIEYWEEYKQAQGRPPYEDIKQNAQSCVSYYKNWKWYKSNGRRLNNIIDNLTIRIPNSKYENQIAPRANTPCTDPYTYRLCSKDYMDQQTKPNR